MWTEDAWATIENVFGSIIDHPFVVSLGDGSLDSAKFLYYVQQDWLYLREYSRALAALAAKLPNTEDASVVAQFAIDAQQAEIVVHNNYLSDGTPTCEMSPTCLAYTSFLARQAAFGSVEMLAAALLPCFWIYEKVGRHISKIEKSGNPFHVWISMYSSDAFGDSCKTFRKICDTLADSASPAVHRQMLSAFLTCSKLEFMFWDAAWKLELWPV